jgi:hydroxymethylglutaryl-CoA synthase
MDLFETSGNTDIEGATVINACYGGTAALLNAVAWVESDGFWDGRYAIVVAADIATYARGPARPTCGAGTNNDIVGYIRYCTTRLFIQLTLFILGYIGAVAFLIGRDAPIAFTNPKERATHASNVWDFFKPDHNVEYPTVDGALSQVCYYRALEDCYTRFADKMDAFDSMNTNTTTEESTDGTERTKTSPFNAESPDYFVFHAPYNKLVQKSYARLYLLDAKRKAQQMNSTQPSTQDEEEKKESDKEGTNTTNNDSSLLEEWLSKPNQDTYSDKGLEKVLKQLAAPSYKTRLADSNYASKHIGNTYTASVFMGIASLIDRAGGRGDLTQGKKITVFSYGSGALATMYMLHV